MAIFLLRTLALLLLKRKGASYWTCLMLVLLGLLLTSSHFSAVCSGGLTNFASDDGSRQLLDMAREMEDTFVTYDASGNPISPAHRFLTDGCTPTFRKPTCLGSCTSCSGTAAKVKCKARQLKCKATSLEGLSFPFMSDPMKVIGLFSGGDIE